MASSTLAINYPGYHGPITATLDWCEANYQFSFYIAEMANSLSNLFTIALALYGLRHVLKESLPTRYTTGYVGFAIVGIGSFAFHATLLFQYQLADELPMIYGTTTSLWCLYDNAPGFNMKSRRTVTTMILIILFDALFTWSYILYRNPIYHQIVFGTIVVGCVTRVAYLVKWSEARLKIPEEKRAQIGNIYTLGAELFVFGFFIWNLDNIFCDKLTVWKTSIGWPAAFLLEGHSWWHLFTGIGSLYTLVGTQCKALCMKGDHRDFQLRWLSLFPI
ncbi:alkaline phytoceramidase [Hymenopellis radicata]|nr:alkaline phytoceramidase [Hymenopellis radicata]